MPSFDPINIFKRMWEMKRWGRVLVIATIILTALAIVALFATSCSLLVIFFAALMWVILVMYYLITTSRLKKSLDKLMLLGQFMIVILRGDTEADYDRCEDHIQEWNESVDNVLRGTEYEYIWKLNIDLETPEDLSELRGLQVRFGAERNYMSHCLSRLKQIRDDL